MKNLFKTIIGMVLCAIQLSASTYQRNDAAVTEFAMTLVNETPDGLKGLLDNYFTHYPEHKGLHEKGVNGSIMMSPMAGKTGAMDQTLTLLRMDPLKNWGISNAQYVYAFGSVLEALYNKAEQKHEEEVLKIENSIVSYKNIIEKYKNELDKTLNLTKKIKEDLLAGHMSTVKEFENILDNIANTISLAL